MKTKTIKIRIKDSGAEKALCKMARAVNFVWNYCNETSVKAIRYNSEWLSGYDLQKLTKGASKELGLNSTTIQEVCSEYALRRQQFKKAKLRWRGRKSLGWIPFKKTGIQFKYGEITFLGKVYRCFQPERVPDKGWCGGEFCQDSRGRWYICISVKYKEEKTTGEGEVGIDLGLKDVAVLSNGERVKNNRYYRMMERKIARAQKYRKKRQVRNLHANVKNCRLDHLHKESTKIVKENNLIVIGNFGAKKLAKTRMAKSINDSATTIFKTMLEYKASALQCRYVEVSENFTTQTCSSCGEIPASSPKGVKGLGVREWVCCNCGAQHDRDINAAMNILHFGRKVLAS